MSDLTETRLMLLLIVVAFIVAGSVDAATMP